MDDRRARLIVHPNLQQQPFINGSFMLPEMGIVFPYTPKVTGIGNTAVYGQYDVVHGNYNQYAYKNSKANDISIEATFTANTDADAQMMVKVIHFLRSCGKSQYGEEANKQVAKGTLSVLPPILQFSYNGKNVFDKVPVVITDHSLTFRDDVDYVRAVVGSYEYYVPTLLVINITLLPQYGYADLIDYLQPTATSSTRGKYL